MVNSRRLSMVGVRLYLLLLILVENVLTAAHLPVIGSTHSLLANVQQNGSTACVRDSVTLTHSPSKSLWKKVVKQRCSGTTKWTVNRKDIEIKILFTADLHGHVESLSRISHLVKNESSSHSNVLLLDCGDISVGTLFAKHYGAGVVSAAMNLVGYSAMALGNHDLEYAKQLSVTFPVLSVNIAGYVPSKLINVGGVRVGLFAYTLTDTLEAQLGAVEEQIRNTAICLRKSGADLVVLIGHGTSAYNHQLAGQLRGLVDAVLGGHTHEVIGCMDGYLQGDVVLHPGAAGEFLGVLHVRRVNQKASYHSRMLAVTQDVPEDPAVAAWLAPKLAALPQLDTPLAHLQVPTNEAPRQCRRGSCPTGSLVTDAVRWHFNCSAIALFEAGSIRDVLAGQVSQQDLVHTLPWDNRIVLYHLTGAALLDLLKRSANMAAAGNGAHLQMSGLSYRSALGAVGSALSEHTAYEVRAAEDSQPQSAKHGGSSHGATMLTHMCSEPAEAQVHADTVYTIAVTDWVAGGGDGYTAYLGNATRLPDTQQSAMFAREMVAEYIQAAAAWREGDLHRRQNRIRMTLAEHYMTQPVPVVPLTDQDAAAVAAQPSRSIGIYSIIAILAEVPALIAAHPLRTISTRQQSKITQTGQGGLWNGAALSLTAVMLSKMIFWVIYYVVLGRMLAVGVVASALHQGLLSFCASIAGGAVEAMLMHPLWVIVVRQQVQLPTTSTTTSAALGTAAGFDKTGTGMFENLCDGLGFSLLLVLFPAVRQSIFEYLLYIVDIVLLLQSTSLSQGVLGMGATMIATILTYPLVTMRTQVQTGSFDCATLRPFAGLPMKLLAASVNAFVFFSCKNLLEVILL